MAPWCSEVDGVYGLVWVRIGNTLALDLAFKGCKKRDGKESEDDGGWSSSLEVKVHRSHMVIQRTVRPN